MSDSCRHLKVSIKLDEGTAAWYAHKAIKRTGIPQAKAVRDCLGAVYGAMGATFDGDEQKAEELREEGNRFLAAWGLAIAPITDPVITAQNESVEQVQNYFVETVQNDEPESITSVDQLDDIIFE